ncbi:hypothetical protein K8R32_03535 [bacterium]|nr:hypothetical protein [bacterium]
MEKLPIEDFQKWNKQESFNKQEATKVNKNEIKNKFIELLPKHEDLYNDILNDNIRENNGVPFPGSDYEARKLLVFLMEIEEADEETIKKKVNKKLQDLRDQEDEDLSAELWKDAA